MVRCVPRLETSGIVAGSFRDPDGFVFRQDGTVFRQVNHSGREDYDLLMSSGLYERLASTGRLIPHEEVTVAPPRPDNAYRVIKPQPAPFISYPYEWCFSQLKEAALTILAIQRACLESGMSLKDASAYNMQFVAGRPVLIDTLSFEKYIEGRPWVAYRQFCQHFLAPLALMSYKDVRLNSLLRTYLDGVPLDLASSLLPFRTRFKFSLLSHIHLHAQSQRKYSDSKQGAGKVRVRRMALLGIIESLESAVRGLKWQPRGTEWADYYDATNYSREAFEHKHQAVADFLDRARPAGVWDLGANTGAFSRLAASRGIPVISIDHDPAAVERNYLECTSRKETGILPLVLDLANPSPGAGWENRERASLMERGPADAVMALALVHHLAISNNTPLDRISGFFSRLCNWLIIEFVPKEDSQVRRLLASREDVFPDYTMPAFEREFGKHFNILESVPIRDSLRTLYLMRREQP